MFKHARWNMCKTVPSLFKGGGGWHSGKLSNGKQTNKIAELSQNTHEMLSYVFKYLL